MKPFRGALLVCLLAAPARAGVGCAEDRADALPFVVRVANAQKEESCTGFVVAGKWVVTAAHCLYAGGKGDPFLTDAASVRVLLGPASERPGPRVKERHVHPGYAGPLSGGPDVAVLELDGAASASVGVAAAAPASGTAAVVAGYGVARHGGWKIDGRRRSGSNVVGSVTPELVCLRKVLLSPEGRGPKGACVPANQDSGSPLLVSGAAAGVFSASFETWNRDGSTLVEDCYTSLARPDVAGFLARFF